MGFKIILWNIKDTCIFVYVKNTTMFFFFFCSLLQTSCPVSCLWDTLIYPPAACNTSHQLSLYFRVALSSRITSTLWSFELLYAFLPNWFIKLNYLYMSLDVIDNILMFALFIFFADWFWWRSEAMKINCWIFFLKLMLSCSCKSRLSVDFFFCGLHVSSFWDLLWWLICDT